MVNIYHYIEQAIMVEREYKRDRQFVIRDGEVVIVDEFTGRLAEGRKWREGVHQAVEAKEGVEVTVATGQAARVTIQDFFLRYENLAGMTGTAMDSARELRKIYRCHVLRHPHQPPGHPAAAADAGLRHRGAEMGGRGRGNLPASRQGAAGAGRHALHRQVGAPLQAAGRAGNRARRSSTPIAWRPRPTSWPRRASAGRVTVSTNMAGRGTDIKLGEGIAELGGLQVICTEMHDAARIDRQLAGRCGRQGDPGTWRQYLALDDDLLLAGLGPKKADRLKEFGQQQSGPLDRLAGRFRKAQRKVERRHFRQRAR